jgi:hypothetical protein
MPTLVSHSVTVAPARVAHPASALHTARRAVAKLSFCPHDDARIIAALATFPATRHSAVLAVWLRAGWRVATGRTVAAPILGAVHPAQAMLQRPVVRRVFVDSAIEPGLADFLGNLPRHERGREIRHFIEVALRAAAPAGAAGVHPSARLCAPRR